MKREKKPLKRIKRLERKTKTPAIRVSSVQGGGSSGGVESFLELTDTPNTYSGEALKVVRVNASEDALEFTTPSGGGGPAIADVYADIAALIADQGSQTAQALYYVTDASTDTTVDSGWAIYEYLGTTNGDLTDYVKIQEQESIDLVVVNASETVKGIVEEATQTELNSGTDTGATGAKLFAPPSKLNTRFAPLASPTFTGTVTVPTPTNGTDAANKAYVDSQVISESEYAKIQAIWYHLNSF